MTIEERAEQAVALKNSRCNCCQAVLAVLRDQTGLSEEQAKRIRTLELLNTSSGGGARVYDMYVRVPATSATGIVGLRTTDRKPTAPTSPFA
jgi:hypothetical protein